MRRSSGLAPIERMIELDRRQPEGGSPSEQYKERVLSRERIERGRELYREHRALLERVAADYGVQPRFIVALWGIESSYGSLSRRLPGGRGARHAGLRRAARRASSAAS